MYNIIVINDIVIIMNIPWKMIKLDVPRTP